MEEKFAKTCQTIIDNRESRALNYCVPYARHGLKCKTKREIHVQGIYMLSNMTHWRGPVAKQIRKDLKAIIKETE